MISILNDWENILNDEDRIIANSDRKFRRHSMSLECMSEELASKYNLQKFIYDEFERSRSMFNFVDLIDNEELANALNQLTDKQRRAIELAFWDGYSHQEIAIILHCDRTAVTKLLKRALDKLASILHK